MIYALLVIVLISALLIWVAIPGWDKGVPPNEIEKHYESFVDSMADGAVMIIKIPKTKMFLQSVVNRDNINPVLQFAFPDAPWSRNLFPKVYQALTDRGEKMTVTKTDVEEVPRMLEVNYSLQDPECTVMMSDLTRFILPIIGSVDKKLNIQFKGDLLPKDEAISRFKKRNNIHP